ncbi:MAG: hypothetical protein ACI8W8_000016 [Rhodothermales bacterium]|jgi:hypothetical protein
MERTYFASITFNTRTNRTVSMTRLLLLLLSASFALGQDRDLLKDFTPAENSISGNWSVAADGVRAAAGQRALTRLSGNIPDDYQLLVDFTRISGEDVVGIVLPVGPVSPAIGLSGWKGQSHGLSRVDGLPTKDAKNPTASRPGLLENGKRYRLLVRVVGSGDQPKVSATLDGKSLFDWQGDASRLQPNIVINLPAPRSIGLAAFSDVVFHRVTLRSSQPVPPRASPPEAVNQPSFEAFNGAVLRAGQDHLKQQPGRSRSRCLSRGSPLFRRRNRARPQGLIPTE